MQFVGRLPFGSIGVAPPFELPDLAFVVGPNGVGKTQLLRAIATGQIARDGATSAVSHGTMSVPGVVLLRNDGAASNWPAAPSPGASGPLPLPLRSGAKERFIKMRRRVLAPFLAELAQMAGVTDEEFERQRPRFWNAAGPYLIERSDGSQFMLQPHAIDSMAMLAAVAGILHNDPSLADVRSIVENQMTGSHPLIDADFAMSRLQDVSWGESRSFAPELASIFLRYRDARHQNRLQKLIDIDDGTNLALTSEEFVAEYGEPPWEKVDRALASFGLPFEVIAPTPTPQSLPLPGRPQSQSPAMSFMLRVKGGSEPLSPAQLSSGEQVLLELAIAIFQHDETRINLSKPELLLLDEKDASLHPANVKRWLEAIADGLVGKQGIKCIITTHSPITVALAPEGSIFEMTEERPYPQKCSKQSALDQLTVGLPTLAIDYSARRQVFTESSIDARHFQNIYDILKPEFDAPFTLSFASNATVGNCQFVLDIVGHMERHGNVTVYGIIDWDLKNQPIGRTRVLGNNSHYSKDNIIIDPLLIGALLVKNDIFSDMNYADLINLDGKTLQKLVDRIVSKVKFGLGETRETSVNHYVGGFSLNVPLAWQMKNGHDLEDLVKRCVPQLGNRYAAEGSLADDLIRRVIAGTPRFCPAPIRDVLLDIASDRPSSNRHPPMTDAGGSKITV